MKRKLIAVASITVLICVVLGNIVACAPTPTTEYALFINSTESGSVTTPGEGMFTCDEGAAVNLVATPDAGYQFFNWTGNVGTIANVNASTTTITMNGDYSITANFEEEEAVTFADLNLEAAIREAISKPEDPIYASDLGGLTSLNASARNIIDLTGLEYATSLTDLVVANNTISDISPLANLTSLTELYLDDNQISDISPLANLTSLTWLWLPGNQISDISTVGNLTSLIRLNLENNQISDISPLANLTSLTVLDLGGNQISDILPLVDNEGLSEGDEVNLEENPLSSNSVNIYIPQLQARGVIVSY